MSTTWHADLMPVTGFSEARVALLEHRGVPHMPGETIRRFIGWRRRNGLSLQIGAMFNLLHGDPAEASPAPYYLCAALETSRPMKRALSAL